MNGADSVARDSDGNITDPVTERESREPLYEDGEILTIMLDQHSEESRHLLFAALLSMDLRELGVTLRLPYHASEDDRRRLMRFGFHQKDKR